MDGNLGYPELSFKGPCLQLMSTKVERDKKPTFPGRDSPAIMNPNGPFYARDCVVSEALVPANYVRDGWLSQRDKFFSMFAPYPNYSVLTETPEMSLQRHPTQTGTSVAHPLPMLQPPEPLRDQMVCKVEEPPVKKEAKQIRKRQNGGAPKAKKPRKSKNEDPSLQVVKTPKKMDLVINGIDMDISSIPIPICSCTGDTHQCYRWGFGGWQSACCTTTLSVYPLPMSEKRRGARIAGRKMSQGAFKKVLEKLAAEGYNFGIPIDLRMHWARHGTNKFVTIR